MKAVILAGGLGTRFAEETDVKPKPMIEIGGKPILWHIMKMYSMHGITDFVICCGYKGFVIKEYFSNYSLHLSDVTFDLSSGEVLVHRKRSEPWKITLVDTGENSMTGGRLLRAQGHLNPDGPFCFTYGDGVSDVNISETVAFHKAHGKTATLTATIPPGRFGILDMKGDQVVSFKEKPENEAGEVNGGFFVLNPSVFDYLQSDATIFEQEPLMSMAENGELMAFRHRGFWQPMDTLRDRIYLENLWAKGEAPWKTW